LPRNFSSSSFSRSRKKKKRAGFFGSSYFTFHFECKHVMLFICW
jgi:hypothetical protein